MAKTKLILRHKWALGDTILLTALVRDIHRAYPGEYDITVDTHWTNVWWNNPYVTQADAGSSNQPAKIEIGWGDAIRWNSYARYGDRREMKHILAWYHYDFELKTGIKVPVTDPRPDLHMDEQEKIRRIEGRYWVIVSGGKLDMTVKHWHAHRAQEVVDKLAARGIACVQVGAAHTSHVHPPLKNTLNLLGKTENVRDLWNIIMYSEGVICGVTGPMHIAAAFEKPCVIYAGGREEPWFEAYTNAFDAFGPEARPVRVEHKFLHTIGLLECCDKQGCWKKRIIPLDPQDLTRQAHTLCRQPVRPEDSHPVAKCQDLITSDHVVEAVMDYYDKRVLPPISIKPEARQNPELAEGIQIPQVELIQVSPEAMLEQLKVVRQPSTETREQKPFQKVHPQELVESRIATLAKPESIYDHPTIGGKLTVCVLCYGNYPELAKKCLTGILETIPEDRLDLRIATNEISPNTLSYLRTLPATKIYVNTTNRYKYPVMREMLWDEQRPITSNYMVWFDDDTWVVEPKWAVNLCQTIIDNHDQNYRMYGDILYHDLAIYAEHGNRPDTWFRQADWWQGRNFKTRCQGPEAPNGSVIDFAVGWCWAAEVNALRLANVPDVRLGHNGGDCTIGEQMHQTGFEIKQWNRNKSLIACPTRQNGGRRGYSEKFPWDPTRQA